MSDSDDFMDADGSFAAFVEDCYENARLEGKLFAPSRGYLKSDARRRYGRGKGSNGTGQPTAACPPELEAGVSKQRGKATQRARHQTSDNMRTERSQEAR